MPPPLVECTFVADESGDRARAARAACGVAGEETSHRFVISSGAVDSQARTAGAHHVKPCAGAVPAQSTLERRRSACRASTCGRTAQSSRPRAGRRRGEPLGERVEDRATRDLRDHGREPPHSRVGVDHGHHVGRPALEREGVGRPGRSCRRYRGRREMLPRRKLPAITAQSGSSKEPIRVVDEQRRLRTVRPRA